MKSTDNVYKFISFEVLLFACLFAAMCMFAFVFVRLNAIETSYAKRDRYIAEKVISHHDEVPGAAPTVLPTTLVPATPPLFYDTAKDVRSAEPAPEHGG